MYEFTDPFVTCSYNGVNCAAILANGCFAGEVDLGYTIENVGKTCHKIEALFAKLNDADPRAIPIDCDSSHSCPGQVWPLSEKRYIDFCDFDDSTIKVSIDVQTNAGDDSPFDFFNSGLVSNPVPPKSTPRPTPRSTPRSTPRPTPRPTPSPVTLAPVPEGEPSICSSTPDQITFLFNYNKQRRNLRHNRDSTKKDSGKKDSGKKDSTPMSGNSQYYDVRIMSLDDKVEYAYETVCDGSEIEIEFRDGFKYEIKIEVYLNGNRVQEVIMNPSCACDNLELGQTFGNFKLIKFHEKDSY